MKFLLSFLFVFTAYSYECQPKIHFFSDRGYNPAPIEQDEFIFKIAPIKHPGKTKSITLGINPGTIKFPKSARKNKANLYFTSPVSAALFVHGPMVVNQDPSELFSNYNQKKGFYEAEDITKLEDLIRNHQIQNPTLAEVCHHHILVIEKTTSTIYLK